MGSYGSRRGAWQAEIASRVDELRGRLKVVEGAKNETRLGERAAIHEAVATSLNTAEAAASGGLAWSRLKAWWTGSAITRAWEAVHNAELALVNIERKKDVRARLAYLLAWIRLAIEEKERRELHETGLEAQIADKSKFDRVQVRRALIDVIAANGNRYANLRVFRNVLIFATGLMAALVAIAAAWHALNPGFLTLCPEGAKTCLGAPQKTEVALVALLGVLGGTLSLALGLTETDVAPSRYDPKRWQAFLKPVTGAVTAVLGIMFVQAGFLVPIGGTKNYALLAYAVLFGFSQQLFTRYVDRKAEVLMTPANEKDGKEAPQRA